MEDRGKGFNMVETNACDCFMAVWQQAPMHTGTTVHFACTRAMVNPILIPHHHHPHHPLSPLTFPDVDDGVRRDLGAVVEDLLPDLASCHT